MKSTYTISVCKCSCWFRWGLTELSDPFLLSGFSDLRCWSQGVLAKRIPTSKSMMLRGVWLSNTGMSQTYLGISPLGLYIHVRCWESYAMFEATLVLYESSSWVATLLQVWGRIGERSIVEVILVFFYV